MNVEVFVNHNCILTVVVREDEANKVAEKLYTDYKIAMLQMVGVPASVYITGVRSKMEGPEIKEILK